MKMGIIQLNSSDDPHENLRGTTDLIRKAAGQGAHCITTPEATNYMSMSHEHQSHILRHQEKDLTLHALRRLALELSTWIHIGSLLLKAPKSIKNVPFLNRSFMISPSGDIAATYDKIHMFDATLSLQERYTESASYQAGTRAVAINTDIAHFGLSICYDLRFPKLYNALAKADADILMIPAAFTVPTGRAHWHTLVRARAIETGCFVVAPGQTGQHQNTHNAHRATYGHSIIVSPWGEVLYDVGTQVGAEVIELDLHTVQQVKDKLPTLQHDIEFTGP